MAKKPDKFAAAKYGDLINAVYGMFKSDPHNLKPAPADFGPEWRHIAWIDMNDFFLGISDPRFYGVVLQATDAATAGFDYAIAIRGTEGSLEWIDDAMALPVPFAPVPDSGRVAYGFDKIYSTLNVTRAATAQRLQTAIPAHTQKTFAEQINALVKADPPRGIHAVDKGEPRGKFLVLGHSLGAALVTLYVIENASLKTVQRIDTLCTYASPRVGWAHFVQQFNALQSGGLTSWRIANVNDVVTHVPFKLLGYRDVDTGIEFSGAKTAKNDPNCMHNMQTYQHYLDPEHYQLPGGCDLPKEIATPPETPAEAPVSIPDAAVGASAVSVPDAIQFTIEVTIPWQQQSSQP
jgi:triacylglycerol lipase